MDLTGLRVVGLLRQSSDQQASLAEQEAQFRQFATRHNMIIIRCWRVIGSVTEENPELFYKEMRARGVTAYDDLDTLWSTRGFDVLWAFDKTRIGRETWLYNNILSRTARAEATVVLHNGGVIESHNSEMMAAFTSIGIRSDIDRLHDERTQKTFKSKADEGIPPFSSHLWTHELIKDKKGQNRGLKVRADAMAFVDIATELLLAGESYRQMAIQMKKHGATKLSRKSGVMRMFNHPNAHGHVGYRLRRQFGAWIFEDGHVIPDGVHMAYNVCPALWEGELHSQVKHELVRRLNVNDHGRYNRRISRNPFADLLYCGLCEYPLAYDRVQQKYEYISCQSYQSGATDCPNRKPMIRLEFFKDFFDAQIRYALEHGILSLHQQQQDNRLDTWQSDLNRYNAQLAEINRVLGQLVLDRAKSPELASIYDTEIDNQAAQRKLIESQISKLKASRPTDPDISLVAIEDIRQMTVDRLWSLPPGDINGYLKRLMGDTRIYMVGYDIVSVR